MEIAIFEPLFNKKSLFNLSVNNHLWIEQSKVTIQSQKFNWKWSLSFSTIRDQKARRLKHNY